MTRNLENQSKDCKEKKDIVSTASLVYSKIKDIENNGGHVTEYTKNMYLQKLEKSQEVIDSTKCNIQSIRNEVQTYSIGLSAKTAGGEYMNLSAINYEKTGVSLTDQLSKIGTPQDQLFALILLFEVQHQGISFNSIKSAGDFVNRQYQDRFGEKPTGEKTGIIGRMILIAAIEKIVPNGSKMLAKISGDNPIVYSALNGFMDSIQGAFLELTENIASVNTAKFIQDLYNNGFSKKDIEDLIAGI